MAASKFWFVWNEAGRSPKKKHTSEGEARKEAARLANENPGHEFVVLESVGSCRTNSVIWEDHLGNGYGYFASNSNTFG